MTDMKAKLQRSSIIAELNIVIRQLCAYCCSWFIQRSWQCWHSRWFSRNPPSNWHRVIHQEAKPTPRKRLQDLPACVETMNLVDTRSTSSASERTDPHPRNRSSGKHNVCTHIPKGQNYKTWSQTKITRAPCRRRTENDKLRAVKFGDLIATDHKGISEEEASRNNDRNAIVVQDLAAQWNRS